MYFKKNNKNREKNLLDLFHIKLCYKDKKPDNKK